jgi:UDP:flavonoid glycosyltransferase YjiC (YdhE family)
MTKTTCKVMIVLNGLGLGNSTRCHAIIQHLKAAGATIEVVTSGNGEWYFNDRPEVSRIHTITPLNYGKKDGKISILRTLNSIGTMLSTTRQNKKILNAAIDSFSPHVVVGDSEYSIGTAKQRGIPVVALNNSDVVFNAYQRWKDRPLSILPQFLTIECLDFLYHKIVPDIVISPAIDAETPSSGGKFKRVGPIVRENFTSQPLLERLPKRVAIMLSGSVFGSPVRLRKDSYPFSIDVIGRPKPEDWIDRDKIVFHGKVRDTRNLLTQADLVVINAGFSAVSEMFYTHKPMIVVPVPRHAEQWINARTIVHLGVGLMAEENYMEAAMMDAVERIDEFRAAYQALPEIPNGAAQATNIILEAASAK